MMAGILPPEQLDRLDPALLALTREDAPTRTILCAGGRHYAAAHVTLTAGLHLKREQEPAAALVARWNAATDRKGEIVPANAWEQVKQALAAFPTKETAL